MKITTTNKILRTSNEFKALVLRMQAGELTRAQVADMCAIKEGTLNVWMTRSKLTKKNNADGTKALHGTAQGLAITDPIKAKALADAVSRVMAGELTVTEVSKLYPELSASTLAAKVRKLKEYAGIPIKRRNSVRP